MKRIALVLVALILLSSCTRVGLGKDRDIIKENATKSNHTLIKNIEDKIGEKIPKLESNLDTPAIVENRIIYETEAVDFGDVV